MGIYIWLIIQNIVIACAGGACMLSPQNGHLEYLIGIGGVELLFELGGVIKIYAKRNGSEK